VRLWEVGLGKSPGTNLRPSPLLLIDGAAAAAIVDLLPAHIELENWAACSADVSARCFSPRCAQPCSDTRS